MSLINDALKRARQTPARPPAAPVGDALLQPTEGGRGTSRSTLGLLFAVIVAALFMAGWFYRQWRIASERVNAEAVQMKATALQVRQPPALAPSSSEPQTSVSPNAPAVPEPPAVAAPAQPAEPSTPAPEPLATSPARVVATPPSPTVPAEPQPRAAKAEEKPAAPPEPAPPPFPTLKLQGIFYSRTKPSTLINGQTLFVGEEVEGARVKAIEALKVVVEFNGQTRTLSLR
jgi:hypothetical protein